MKKRQKEDPEAPVAPTYDAPLFEAARTAEDQKPAKEDSND